MNFAIFHSSLWRLICNQAHLFWKNERKFLGSGDLLVDILVAMDSIPCTYRVSVKAAIYDAQGKILLLREKDGSWDLPGGGLEHSEDPRQALMRELSEETGMAIIWMSDKPEAFWTIHEERDSDGIAWFGFVLFQTKVTGDFMPNLANNESQEARFFTRAEAKLLKLHENAKPYFT